MADEDRWTSGGHKQSSGDDCVEKAQEESMTEADAKKGGDLRPQKKSNMNSPEWTRIDAAQDKIDTSMTNIEKAQDEIDDAISNENVHTKVI